ncbi:hypothetical protein E4U56_006731, partial [Claviceps arundinis]
MDPGRSPYSHDMIEAARQREVALGFVSDLLAMAKHTNKITKHSETVCQDLLEQVRVLTDKLAKGDSQEANEDEFRVQDQFTQNVEDLKRRGGGSGKSAKIPDPERLDNGVSPKYKAWKGDMIAKLTINEDMYVTDAARVAYCLSRLTGQARDHVEAARGCDENAAFGSYTNIFAVLDQIYIDPDGRESGRNAFVHPRIAKLLKHHLRAPSEQLPEDVPIVGFDELNIGNRDVILGLKWMEKHGVSLDPTKRRIIWPPERPALQESELPRLILWTPEDLLEPWKVDPAHQNSEGCGEEEPKARPGGQEETRWQAETSYARAAKGRRDGVQREP